MKGKHEIILMIWVINLNNGIDHLAFECEQTAFGHKLEILTPR
jgi:hypothetical protein